MQLLQYFTIYAASEIFGEFISSGGYIFQRNQRRT